MKIIFSNTAIESLKEIVDFLNERWTQKELKLFNKDLEKFPNVKYTFIGKKQVKLFYEVKENTVVIKLFWHCRQNPENIQKLLDI